MPSPLPWFPMYVASWLSSTAIAAMLPEQIGGYIMLLCVAWNDGTTEPSLPDDPVQLAQLSRLGARWKKLGPLVREQFEARDGRLYNAKLSAVYAEQRAKHDAASEKASRAALARQNRRRSENASGTAPGDSPSTAPGSAPSTPPSTPPSTQKLDGTASPPTPNGVEGEKHVPAPDGARGSEGAAPPGANGGDYLQRASTRDELARRGFRPDERLPGPAPVASIETDAQERLTQYEALLADAANDWMAAHPADAKAIGATHRRALGLPESGDVPLPKLTTLRALVVEDIRRRQGWPTDREWDGITPFGADVAAAAGGTVP